MRILLLADIHANWAALSAIDEPFDQCVFLGDLVDYGTEPSPCIDWVMEHADHAIRGNHDHAVAQNVAARPGIGFRDLAAGTRPHQARQLTSRQLKYLARLPLTKSFTAGPDRFTLWHATPRDPLDEYLAADRDAWDLRLQNVEADFVCVGHTHLPFHLDLGRLQVINPGSVGQPRDGDPRASYAIIDNGRVEFRRVAYNIDAAVAQMRRIGLDPLTLQSAEFVLRTGGRFPCAIDQAYAAATPAAQVTN